MREENMSGSEIIERVVEYMNNEKESHRDRARRIYQFVCKQLQRHLYNDEVPIWLVWEHYYEGEIYVSQLRSINVKYSLAEKHKKIIEDKSKKKVHITIEGTKLNHLFAWKMIQRLGEKK